MGSEINAEKVRFSLGWVVALLVAVVPAGGVFAVGQAQDADQDTDLAELKTAHKAQVEINHQMDKRMTLTEEGQKRIETALERIERKLDGRQ